MSICAPEDDSGIICIIRIAIPLNKKPLLSAAAAVIGHRRTFP